MQQRPDEGDSVAVAPGVFARNLRVQRKIGNTVSSYVEGLCYEDPREFRALLQKSHSLTIGGVETFYSDRLEQLEHAIRDGVVNFVQTRSSLSRLSPMNYLMMPSAKSRQIGNVVRPAS